MLPINSVYIIIYSAVSAEQSRFGSNQLLVFTVAHEARTLRRRNPWWLSPRVRSAGLGDLTLGGAELEEIKDLRILGVTLDSKLRFETHLREVVSKAARSLEAVRRAG